MSIIYMCRHCKQTIGILEDHTVTTSMLGLDQLTADEKRKIVHYEANGNVHINVICDSCEDSLNEHPNYHELDFFIQ